MHILPASARRRRDEVDESFRQDRGTERAPVIAHVAAVVSKKAAGLIQAGRAESRIHDELTDQ